MAMWSPRTTNEVVTEEGLDCSNQHLGTRVTSLEVPELAD